MNILFDIGHPAHVHLFKHFISYLADKKKHQIHVVTRDKEITNTLLKHYNIPFRTISSPRKGLIKMFFELLIRGFRIWILHRQIKFDYAIGTSVSIGHLSLVTRNKVVSLNFNEDDDEVVPLYAKLAYPHSTRIINPDCIRFKSWSGKRVLVNSYHELAYLHPNNFSPNEGIITKYGLKKKNYIIFRLSALSAHHDIGEKGISEQLKQVIKNHLSDYIILESNEGVKGGKIKPWDMHHILAFAKMIISDSQTMTIEAAVLGVPAVRVNTFIGRSTVIDELENKYHLAYGFYPHQEKEILKTVAYLATNDSIEADWNAKKSKLLEDKVDFNKWMIDYFESYNSKL